MTSPDLTTKVTARKPQDKAAFGQKLAKRRSQEFSAKIARWNSTGGGIHGEEKEAEAVVVIEEQSGTSDISESPAVVEVVMPAAAEEKEEEDTGTPLKISTSPPVTPRKTTREVDINRKAWVRRKSKSQADKPVEQKIEVTPDIKHASTPKKRVVSDGHWRRDRIVKPEKPEKPESPEKEVPIPVPKPIVIRNSIANIGIRTSPSSGNAIAEREERAARRKAARRPRSPSPAVSQDRSTGTREDAPDYASSGTRVYIKKRTPIARQQAESTGRDLSPTGVQNGPSMSSADLQSDNNAASPSAKLASPSPVVQRYMKLLVPVEDQLSVREPTEEPVEALSRRRRSSKRSPRTSDHKDSTIVDEQVVQPPSVYGNRIQGWLATTSDPFESSADTRPVRARANDVHNRHKTVGESVQSPRSGRGLSSEQDPDQSPTTPTLRRRGARRTNTSPVKHRISADLTKRLGSDIEQDLVPRPLSLQLQLRPDPTIGAALAAITSAESRNIHPQPSNRHRSIENGSAVSHASDGDERQTAHPLRRRLTKHEDLMSVLSAHRARTGTLRSRDGANVGDMSTGGLMNELTALELKYQRELRTLVDGVIPVLLQYVLSTNQNLRSAGSSPQDSQLVTRPIVDMGIALERLKNVHKRIPLHDARELIAWADTARTVYVGYIAAWRLGFQDIVVNLAPADSSEKSSSRWDNGVPRNERGELTSNDGAERVDVAYLLKRPLVRLKQLAKTFEALVQLKSDLPAQQMASYFDDLLQQARARVNEEKARLEDEAAAGIDPTRARECRTLAPIADVQIDATRCVKARDFFDLDFRHSSGQQINCKIELIMRDDAVGKGQAGDILFCEVSSSDKWLLFPPVHSTMISARQGRKSGQMVVMLRGYRNDGREWREVLALETDDEDCISEWLGMLPSSPVPRNLATKSSFDLKQNPIMSGALPAVPDEGGLERLPSVREVEVPLGERFAEPTERWDASEVNSDAGSLRSKALRRKRIARHQSQPAESIPEEPYAFEKPNATFGSDRPRPMSEHHASAAGRRNSVRAPSSSRDDYNVWIPPSQNHSDESSADEEDETLPKRPSMRRRTSSVPSLNFPTVNKLRRGVETTPEKCNAAPIPASAPAKVSNRRRTSPEEVQSPSRQESRSRPTSFGLKASILPSFTPAFLKKNRRSSSPLKHEYEPSTASSLPDSEVSAVIEHDEAYTSDSSTEQQQQPEPEPDDQISTLGELKSFPTYGGYKQMRQATPPESLYAPSAPSLAPSQSASQAPYRTVPSIQSTLAETVASIFAWSESGSWDSLHPEDCCIIVTPGLIEAFDSTQAHAVPATNDEEACQSPSTRGVKPLVALELTPLVPLRRGTALDISVRSPPTSNSLYRTGNNIMFRSRNAEECERLYHLLNRARIDNPTYIALQRARGPMAQSNWGEVMEQRANNRPASGSWFGGLSRKGSTYRSKSVTRPHSIAATESSVGTMQTAFSALRRFSGSNKIFNIAKSTITSRQGSRSTYSDSLDSGIATPAIIDPSMGTPVGLTNMKIRLYIRETASKWRDMGAARLTILIPPRADPSMPANPMLTGREKRVLISGKSQGEMLVDATLGEASFERIARTGIAMSVWEENVGGLVATTGGVLAAKTKVYMIQMKSDREAAYTFGLVGKLRY